MLSEYYNYIYIVAGIIVLAVCIRVLSILIRKIMQLRSPLRRIDRMSGVEFEKYLGAHFKKRGYRVEYTPDSHDYGADLILHDEEDIIAVQAKRYSANVGTKAVQEVVAARNYYGATRGMVITNSFFTRPAKELAKANGITLWDRDDIEKRLVRGSYSVKIPDETEDESLGMSMRDIKQREYEEGYADGILVGIKGTVAALAHMGQPESEIINELVKVYGLTAEEAEDYILD